MKKLSKKYVLVNYNVVIGEYEVRCHTVIEMPAKTEIEDGIHRYFIEFWSKATEWNKASYYFYGDKAVKIRGVRKINLKQRQVLRELGIA